MMGLELEFLTRSVTERMSLLCKEYKDTVQGIGPSGNMLSSGSIRVARHKIKSSLQELALVSVLLDEVGKHNPEFVLDDSDATSAFMHMVAPKTRRNDDRK